MLRIYRAALVSLATVTLGVAGCGSPVERCNQFPDSDCCASNAECFDYYGADYAFCNRAERDIGGTCGACNVDGDCTGDARCAVVAPSGQTQCIDPDSCYDGAPFSFTGCTGG